MKYICNKAFTSVVSGHRYTVPVGTVFSLNVVVKNNMRNFEPYIEPIVKPKTKSTRKNQSSSGVVLTFKKEKIDLSQIKV